LYPESAAKPGGEGFLKVLLNFGTTVDAVGAVEFLLFAFLPAKITVWLLNEVIHYRPTFDI